MPANTITYQPATAQLLAAYRPIVLKVEATATEGGAAPPFVICDIYINDIYYKSIVRTSAESSTDLLSSWQFDIADALQEYLAPDIAAMDNSEILQARHMSAKVFCKFRASDLDDDGLTVEEPDKPVQGTKFTDPVSGTGLQSNSFYVINSALQHEDNQNLEDHLDAYKKGDWDPDAYPLSHRDKYFFCPGDSDHFPVIFLGDCIETNMKLHYRLKGESVFNEAIADHETSCDPVTYSLEVTGNQVAVSLDAPLADGENVRVEYKKQADADWINAGTFTDQNFSFNVNGDDIAGDYDIRIIHFCSTCLFSDPTADVFTLDGSEINLAWRGIDPFCVVSGFEDPVFVELELRNHTHDVDWFPNIDEPIEKTEFDKYDLYCKFFSDAAHLVPLNLVQNDVKIFVKRVSSIEEYNGVSTYNRIYEEVLTYEVDVNGVEVLLENVEQEIENESYPAGEYPTVSSSSHTIRTYAPYPDHELTGGNTGDRGFENLEEYNTDTNAPTGVTKPNDDSDPDYIAPVADEAACPSGPDVTTATYGYSLQISKVEFAAAGDFLYADTVADTTAGGYQYVVPVPRNTNVNIAVKAKTLDVGNVTGLVHVRVTYVDGGGVLQNVDFTIPNNVETTLPQIFQNVNNVNISNY